MEAPHEMHPPAWAPHGLRHASIALFESISRVTIDCHTMSQLTETVAIAARHVQNYVKLVVFVCSFQLARDWLIIIWLENNMNS